MAETKKGVVRSVTGNGTWDSKYGTMYKFEVSFDNGDAGEYNSKSQDQTKFVIGQEAEYTISSREYNGNMYYTIKPAQPAGGYSGGGYKSKADPEKDKRIAKLAVLKSATELVVADKIGRQDIFVIADEMMKWVYDEKVTIGRKEEAVPHKPVAVLPNGETDDLPF